MKTQKQLPNEFTFICDEHSKEQLEKLGVENPHRYVIADKQIYKHKFSVKNNIIIYFGDNEFNYPLINLADYIEQEQPEQKWQPLTRGGFDYRIYEEFKGKIYGRVKTDVGNWLSIHWYYKGNYSYIENHNWDLLPYNPLLTTLKKELEEVRSKEKEILEKIEELKK